MDARYLRWFAGYVFSMAMIGISASKGFDRPTCLLKVQEELKNGSVMATDTSLFAIDFLGNIMSNITTPSLTIAGCKRECGDGNGIYPDFASRLLTWLIPTILLVTNMEFAPIGIKRFVMVLHLFGDPVDSLWSLMSKVESWSRWLYKSRSQYEEGSSPGDNERSTNLAVVMSALEELITPSLDTFQIEYPIGWSCLRPELDSLYRDAAINIIDCKTHGTSRTWFSILLYIFGIVANFIPALGGSPSPSGGKIATAMCLSWILPTTLISNVVGQFNSSRDCPRILLRLKDQIESLQKLHDDGNCSNTCQLKPDWMKHLENRNWNQYLDSLAWSSGIYSFQLHKNLPETSQGHNPKLLVAVSVLPITISFVTAFIVLYSAPTYFTCRHFMIISAFLSWLLSPILTWMIAKLDFNTDKARWSLVLLKDAIIAIPIILLLIASSCGLFNSCWCWSGIYTLGSRAAVQLNPVQQFNRNNNLIYPLVIAFSLLAQFGTFLWVLWIGRAGLRIMQQSEEKGRAGLPKVEQSSLGQESQGSSGFMNSGSQLLVGEAGSSHEEFELSSLVVHPPLEIFRGALSRKDFQEPI